MLKIIFLLSFVYSMLLSFEISKNMTFDKKLKPTIMSSSITASMQDIDKIKIQKLFKEAIEISTNKNICTNGSYIISPEYKYIRLKDGLTNKTFNGYTGNIRFDCKFKDTKKIDNIISKMDNISSQKDKLKLTLNPIVWILEENISKEESNKLELKALRYANDYSKYLSDGYSKKCTIKKIDLHGTPNISRPRPLYGAEISMARESISTKPINSELTLKYNASYLFSCN